MPQAQQRLRQLPTNGNTLTLNISESPARGHHTRAERYTMTPTEKLLKELRRLQRELNSPRLMTYTEGDQSEQEMSRQRERASKLARFNDILATLNKG